MTDEEVAKFLGEASEIYSSSTLRIICHILRSALELAHDAGLCAAVNGRFQLPHGARHEARILSQEDQLRLLETLRPEDGPVQLGILLCMYTGMRLGEGTGAVAAMPLLDMARAVYMDCYTFEEGGIEAYTPQGGEG